mmetsp:Transcript_25779/g.60176  ORF Transcript_25779/g.60176 Transcript_25779/m.60176 type:complete len:318 (-) Transcript_25779:123-1076(-)
MWLSPQLFNTNTLTRGHGISCTAAFGVDHGAQAELRAKPIFACRVKRDTRSTIIPLVPAHVKTACRATRHSDRRQATRPASANAHTPGAPSARSVRGRVGALLDAKLLLELQQRLEVDPILDIGQAVVPALLGRREGAVPAREHLVARLQLGHRAHEDGRCVQLAHVPVERLRRFRQPRLHGIRTLQRRRALRPLALAPRAAGQRLGDRLALCRALVVFDKPLAHALEEEAVGRQVAVRHIARRDRLEEEIALEPHLLDAVGHVHLRHRHLVERGAELCGIERLGELGGHPLLQLQRRAVRLLAPVHRWVISGHLHT